eukprot:533772-Pelagomonas_calceolata.AAC.13
MVQQLRDFVCYMDLLAKAGSERPGHCVDDIQGIVKGGVETQPHNPCACVQQTERCRASICSRSRRAYSTFHMADRQQGCKNTELWQPAPPDGSGCQAHQSNPPGGSGGRGRQSRTSLA